METKNETKAEINRRIPNEINAFKGGVTNWIGLLFTFLCLHLISDNYIKYGIIKTPYDLTVDLMIFFKTKGFVLPVTYIGYIFQSFFCYIIEVAIIKEWVKEKYGLILHALNTLFLMHLIIIVYFLYDIHGMAAFKMIGIPFFTAYKIWSFAWENKICRENNRRNKLKGAKNEIVIDDETNKGHEIFQTYPDNVTFKNVLIFTVCTSSLIYNVHGVKKTKRDYKKLLRMLVESILIHYMIAFVIHQYILPDCNVLIKNYQEGLYLHAISCAFKLILPVQAIWFLHHFLYCLRYMLNFPSVIWGTDQDTIVTKDWWNAENNNVFWTKWNFQVHLWFKNYVYIPLIKMGYSKQHAAYAVGFVTGVFHEYMCSATFRTIPGVPTLTMLGQVPLGTLTTYLQKNWGPGWGNLGVFVILIIETLFNAVAWYDIYF